MRNEAHRHGAAFESATFSPRRHDGSGGRSGRVALLTGIESASS
jgi:hypothetical protein